MNTAEIAHAFLGHVAAGEDDKAQTFWSDDIVSHEGGDGPMNTCRGRAEVLKKHEWWGANTQVHGFKVEGPFIHDDRFAAIFEIDATHQGQRAVMREVAEYLVRDGKIVEERFFHLPRS